MQLVDLETFKTKKCQKQHEPSLSTTQLHCPFFHSKDDKRRPPFNLTKTALIYTNTYIEDYFSTQMASNLIEHLFHPDIYKTIPCKDQYSPAIQNKHQVTCKYKWCPYLHQGEDVSSLAQVRNLPVMGSGNEDDLFCEKIESAEDLKEIIKGNKPLLDGSYSHKIDKYKDFFKSLSKSYLEQLEKETAVVDAALPVNAQAKQEEKENWYTEYQYFYYTEKLPLIEDRYHQFKKYWDIVNNNIAPVVMKYISAFLNSDGGVLYVGIDDHSIVHGFEMTQHEFDKFLLNLDSESKLNMLPPLLPHKYAIRRIPVINTKKGKELWVVEVKVTPSELDKRNKVLTLYNREAFMRMNASTQRLDTVNIIEYLRHHQEEKQEQKTRMQILEELSKNVEKKDKPMTLQECLELKEKVGKLGEKLEEMAVSLRRKEGEKL